MRFGLQHGLILGACVLGTACGPATGGDGSADGSGSGTGSDSQTSTSDGTTSDSGTTGDDGSGSQSSGETSTDDTTTGGGSCPGPEPEVVTADFSITPLPPGEELDLSLSCTVDEVSHALESTTVELTCALQDGAQLVTLTFGSTGHIAPLISVGEPVILDYVVEPIWWINRWFALRSAGVQAWLLAAGVDGSALDPPGTTIDAFLAQPTLARHEGICEPTMSDCGLQERLAMELAFGDDTTQVIGPGTGYAGGLAAYRIALERATHFVGDIQCTDTPSDWYDLAITFVPEG